VAALEEMLESARGWIHGSTEERGGSAVSQRAIRAAAKTQALPASATRPAGSSGTTTK